MVSFQSRECSKRLVRCTFCDLSYELAKFADHVNHCGSRTEECAACKQRVQLKDRELHDESNCQYPEPVRKPSPPPSQNNRGIKIPKETIPSRLWDSPIQSRRFPFGASAYDPCSLNQMFSPDFNQVFLIILFLFRPNLKDQDSNDDDDDDDDVDYRGLNDDLFPCEFCHKSFTSDSLFQHQVIIYSK